jgi:CMP/dCMP kinase
VKENSQIVITISRQLGSGGAYIGQQLAKKLDIFYLDREIIKLAAEKLSILEDELEQRDERTMSFWQAVFSLTLSLY